MSTGNNFLYLIPLCGINLVQYVRTTVKTRTPEASPTRETKLMRRRRKPAQKSNRSTKTHQSVNTVARNSHTRRKRNDGNLRRMQPPVQLTGNPIKAPRKSWGGVFNRNRVLATRKSDQPVK